MKLSDILLEVNFIPYRAMVQVISTVESTTRLAELLRALPGVTTVTAAGSNELTKTYVFKVKLITQKNGAEAFEAFKKSALERYPDVKVVKIANKTIERMKLPGDY